MELSTDHSDKRAADWVVTLAVLIVNISQPNDDVGWTADDLPLFASVIPEPELHQVSNFEPVLKILQLLSTRR